MNDDVFPVDLITAAFRQEEFWPRERIPTVIVYTIAKKLDMLRQSGQLERFMKRLSRNATTYRTETPSDIFNSILTLDVSLDDLFKEFNVPDKWEGNKFRPVHGPAPEFCGPKLPKKEPFLRRVLPSRVPAPEGFQVQPLFKHIENLPILPSFTDYMGTLKSLTEVQPLNPEKRFTLKPGSPEAFQKVGEFAKDSFRRLGFQIDD